MNKKRISLWIMSILLLALLTQVAIASSPIDNGDGSSEFVPREDNRPDPLTTKQLELKEQALAAKLNGKAYGKTREVARGQFVELEREGEGALWTVIGEFADLQHNTIPEPDRNYDNTTLWTSDFSRDYYLDLLFNEAPGANSMRNFYIEQSSNRYTVHAM